MAYAEKTSVTVEKSKADIEKTLERYGADQFSYGRDDELGRVFVMFRAHGLMVRFVVQMPKPTDREISHTSQGERSADAARRALDQACRQRWRAMHLCIKAKLEAVESGITQFEDEFLAHAVLPDGRTAGDWLRPQIAEAYRSGLMPSSLLALPAPPAED